MSEFQHIAFRAIDTPVTGKNLEYMNEQSSRAEITPWSFDCEYQYASFRGNAIEMLRRGYDLHLNYANYGICQLMIRLPFGFPDPVAAKPFFAKDALKYIKDPTGPGGIVSIQPYIEGMEQLFNLDDLFEAVLPIRAEILTGDLRPLYLAHLVIACDDEHDPEQTREGPVPAGLSSPSHAQRALMRLYSMGDHLIDAAGKNAPPLPEANDLRNVFAEWIAQQPVAIKDAWLADILSNSESTAKRDIQQRFQKDHHNPWPTVRLNRTIAELMADAEEMAQQAAQRATSKAAANRKKRLAKIALDLAATLSETEQLVKTRRTESYRDIATLLADLREALAGTDKSNLAEQQAIQLRASNPTLGRLVAELRRAGFLKK